MKNLWIALILALITEGGLQAQGPRWDSDDHTCFRSFGDAMGPMMWEKRHRGESFMDALEEVDLSNEQIDKIKSIRDNTHKLNIPLRGQLELKQTELRELMTADKPDRDKVSAKIKEMETVRTQLQINRTNAHIDMLAVLSKEQRDKLERELFDRGGFGKKRMKRFLED